MASIINASTSTGLVTTADTSGVLQLQTVGTTALTVDASQNVTLANGTTIQGLTVGRGAGAVSTNTAVGASALAANTTGLQNSAFGISVLASNTTGSSNSAFGRQALASTTTGGSNTAVGVDALVSNTTASNNTAVGYQAGYTNTTGTENTFIGYQAGYTSNYNGEARNTAVGRSAGYGLTTGRYNNFFGAGTSGGSGELVTTGSKNTILGGYNGNQGGLDIRTASNYIVLSDGDGRPVGYLNGGNTFTINAAGQNPTLVLAESGSIKWYQFNDSVSSNRLTITSNFSTGVILTTAATSWSALSDERLKDIIEPIGNAVDKVSNLRAVIGKYKTDEEGTRRAFLIAQDLQTNFPEAVDDEDKDGMLSARYTDVVPLLVAAIKELKADLDATKAELAALKGTA